MRLSFYSSEKDTSPEVREVSWEELKQLLSETRVTSCSPCPGSHCAHKKGKAWSPAVIRENGRRCNEAVEAISCAVFDIDDVSETDWRALMARVDASGYAAIYHSSHSNKPPDSLRGRLILSLSEACSPAAWHTLRAALITELHIPADPQTKDLSRLYYLPSTPGTSEDYFFSCVDGKAVSVTTLVDRISTLATPTDSDTPKTYNLEEVKAKLSCLTNPESKDLIQRALSGQPLAESGARDTTIHRLVSILLGKLGCDFPMDVALELCRTSINSMPNADGEDWIDGPNGFKVKWHRISGKAKKEEETNKKLLKAITTVSKKKPEAPAGAAEVDAKTDYEADSPENKLWIIQCGKAYYVRKPDGNYYPPICRDDRSVFFRDKIERDAQLDVYTFTKDGNARLLSPDEICRRYGSVAPTINASVSLQKSYFDPETEIFHEAVCPVRNLKPVFHSAIQNWLELLGGEQKDKLLDWIAAVTLLDKQCCALYMHGPGGIGKTLLATGLARLWHKGGPTELQDIINANFNDGFTRCPLVVADERIPTYRGSTADLRQLIGVTSRTMKRKFMPSCDLTGAIRLIIAGNNSDLLESVEKLSVHDIAAIAGRTLIINAKAAAGEFLKAYGGSAATESWVVQDAIAKHALWLRDNRTLDMRKRFIVEGDLQQAHERILIGNSITSAICEFLVSYLSDPRTKKEPDPYIMVGEGEILVSTNALNKPQTWSSRVPATVMPGPRKLGLSLANLSLSSIRIRNAKVSGHFHRIKKSVLAQWGFDAGVIDREALRLRLYEPNPAIAELKNDQPEKFTATNPLPECEEE